MTLVLALWGTTATAQVRLGVKGGYNYTNWKFGKLDLKGDGKNGFFVGPTLKINLPAIVPAVGFGLNVSGLYDQRKVKVGEADPVEIKTKMVAVPVNLQLDFLRGSSLELFVFAGPEFDFNLDNDQHILDAARTWKFKDSAFSINAGAGILLLNCLQERDDLFTPRTNPVDDGIRLAIYDLFVIHAGQLFFTQYSDLSVRTIIMPSVKAGVAKVFSPVSNDVMRSKVLAEKMYTLPLLLNR